MKNSVKSLFSALFGAILFSIPSIIIYQFGYLSSGFFMLIAYGAVLFYRKSGEDVLNRKYIIWLITLAVTTIICLGLFPYLISVTEDIKLKALFNSSSFMAGLAHDYIYSLIFAIVGVWAAISTEKRKVPVNEDESLQKVIDIYHKYNALSKENSVSEIKIFKELDIPNKFAYFTKLEKMGIIVSPYIKSYLDEDAIKDKKKARKNIAKNLLAAVINTFIFLIIFVFILVIVFAE